jgi:CRISPR/Cas system-associated exonuclease Cas4 (RecB family)
MIPLGYSKIADYLDCPRKFHDKYVVPSNYDHDADKNSPILTRGKELHASVEMYIRSRLENKYPKPLVQEAANAKGIVDRILDNYEYVQPEQRVAIDENWENIPITEFWKEKTNQKTYMRAVYDIVAIEGDKALLCDVKTGKFRPYADSQHSQLKLSAAILMSVTPQVQSVKTAYLYIDHKKTVTVEFNRDQLEDIKQPFINIAKEINETEHFDEKPSSSCRWCKALSCPFRK